MKKMIKDGMSFILIMAMIIYSGLIIMDAIWKHQTPEFSIEVESEYNPEYKDKDYKADDSEYVYDDDDDDEEYDRLNDESSYSYSF